MVRDGISRGLRSYVISYLGMTAMCLASLGLNGRVLDSSLILGLVSPHPRIIGQLHHPDLAPMYTLL